MPGSSPGMTSGFGGTRAAIAWYGLPLHFKQTHYLQKRLRARGALRPSCAFNLSPEEGDEVHLPMRARLLEQPLQMGPDAFPSRRSPVQKLVIALDQFGRWRKL